MSCCSRAFKDFGFEQLPFQRLWPMRPSTMMMMLLPLWLLELFQAEGLCARDPGDRCSLRRRIDMAAKIGPARGPGDLESAPSGV